MNNDMLPIPVGTTIHINPEDVKWEQNGGDLISREDLLNAIHKVIEEAFGSDDIYDQGYNNGLFKASELVDSALTVAVDNYSMGYQDGFRDGYAQCFTDKEERKENSRLFRKGGAEECKNESI